MQKVKITQKDFDEIYEIDTGITEETPTAEEDTTPKTENILTEEEQKQDDIFHEDYDMIEKEED